jgi:hypothetical protein
MKPINFYVVGGFRAAEQGGFHMGIKEKLLDLIERTYQEEQTFMQGLTDEQRSVVGTSEQWSAKDIVAHVIAWQSRMMDNHEAAAHGETHPTYDDFNHENELIFQAHRDHSWDDLRREADEIHHRMAAWFQGMSEDDLSDPARFAWLNGQPLWKRIIGNSVTHPLLHFAEYNAKHGQREHATHVQETIAPLLIALEDTPDQRGVTLYNLACYYALADLKDKALTNLAEALRLRPNLIEWSRQDPDLAALRDDPGYQALYTQQ